MSAIDRFPALRAHLRRDHGGTHYPRWMTPTELLWQLGGGRGARLMLIGLRARGDS
jgi:hypothetical protein